MEENDIFTDEEIKARIKGDVFSIEFDQRLMGKAVKTIRTKLNITKEELGARVRLPKGQITRMENGNCPNYTTFIRVFKALGATAVKLNIDGEEKVEFV